MKILIVGISGSGKSTLAKRIINQRRLPLLHLDSIWWQEDWHERDAKEVAKLANTFIAKNTNWVIEGYVNNELSPVLAKADHILYLDYGRIRVTLHVLKRWAMYFRKERPEITKGCIEKPSWNFLWIVMLRKERSEIENLVNKYPTKVIRCKNIRQASKFLASI